jgi:hypothetical protein
MMTWVYEVKRTGKPWEAQILLNDKHAGELRAGKGYTFILESVDGSGWRLTNHVHGERRPFSMRTERITSVKRRPDGDSEFLVKNHLFEHDGKFYLLGGTPVDSSRSETLLGRRYIVRIDGFPYKRIEDIDELTMSRLIHHRGTVVGEISGLGLQSHQVKIGKELAGIGLVLAACSYLMYSTG